MEKIILKKLSKKQLIGLLCAFNTWGIKEFNSFTHMIDNTFYGVARHENASLFVVKNKQYKEINHGYWNLQDYEEEIISGLI